MIEQTLSDLPLNTKGYIKHINCTESTKRRLLDLGLVKNSCITPILQSPAKDPKAFDIRGTLIAIRKEDTDTILIHF